MESLSAYARQFLDQLKKPDVEDIEGLPPTIAIEQRSSGRSPRSTVATSTEIYDYLRLLFARVGTPTCWAPLEEGPPSTKKATKNRSATKKAATKKAAVKRVAKKSAAKTTKGKASSKKTGKSATKKASGEASAETPAETPGEEAPSVDAQAAAVGPARCGLPISRMPPSQITDQVARLEEGTRLMVLAPVIRSKKGFHREVLEDFAKQGFVRARVNGTIIELAEVLEDASENPLKLGRYEKHTIEAVVDRLTIREGARARLNDSLETALKIADGVATVAVQQADKSFVETTYSEHHACAEHPHCSLEELEPRLFSFNSPHGACPECHGLGVLMEFDPALVLPDPDKSISKSGIAPWTKAGPAGMFSAA